MEPYATIVISILFAVLIAIKIQQLPYGPASPAVDRPWIAKVDTSIKNLSTRKNMKLIYENVVEGKLPLLVGPETVILDDDGIVYTLTRHGKLIRLHNIRETEDSNFFIADTEEISNFGGSPLGGKFVPGTKIMYFADDHLGLCRIDISKPNPKVEIVAKSVKLEDGTESPITFADDLDIGPITGKVYFSDATTVRSEFDAVERKYDSMRASVVDFLRGVKSGRLLEYDPVTDQIRVLANGIWFANGVAADREERFLVISETFMFRILKFHLEGPKKGELEVIVDNLTAMPDGADCSKTHDICYSPLPSSATLSVRLLYSRYTPKWMEKIIKTLFLLLPKEFTPKPGKYGCIIEYSSDDAAGKGKVLRIFQDPFGDEVNFLTGVTIYKDNLYFASIHNNFIGIIDIA